MGATTNWLSLLLWQGLLCPIAIAVESRKETASRCLKLAITDALGGDLTDENCRLLTGFTRMMVGAATPDDVNIEDLLARSANSDCRTRRCHPQAKHRRRSIRRPSLSRHRRGAACLLGATLGRHRTGGRADQEPGWNPDPNDSRGLLLRRERLQYLIWWANWKGTTAGRRG